MPSRVLQNWPVLVVLNWPVSRSVDLNTLNAVVQRKLLQRLDLCKVKPSQNIRQSITYMHVIYMRHTPANIRIQLSYSCCSWLSQQFYIKHSLKEKSSSMFHRVCQSPVNFVVCCFCAGQVEHTGFIRAFLFKSVGRLMTAEFA